MQLALILIMYLLLDFDCKSLRHYKVYIYPQLSCVIHKMKMILNHKLGVCKSNRVDISQDDYELLMLKHQLHNEKKIRCLYCYDFMKMDLFIG